MAGLIKRGKIWHLRMRVPKRYLPVVESKEIHRSLGTDSERRARELLPDVEAKILAELDAMQMLQKNPAEADSFKAAQKIAQARGFEYKPISDLLDAPLDEVLARVETAALDGTKEAGVALLGGAEAPGLRLSGLVAEIERIAAHENRYKNEDQMRRWRNPRIKAVNNLKSALGGANPFVAEIDNAAALKHKAWWQRKITAQKQSSMTANKDFNNLAGMLRRYYESIAQPNAPEPYHRVSIKDRHQKVNRKLEIPADWIQEKWLAPGALEGTNDQARDILLISIETGCRQSEIHDLPPSAFVLDHDIPHLWIGFEEGIFKREIKNVPSGRMVPLVGVALAAAKRHPHGFPRYRGKSSYSATINNWLRSHELLPSSNHTVGGVRHAFETRLKNANVSSDDRGEMMGHSVSNIRDREQYGDEMSLEKKHQLATLIAFPVPAHLA